MPIKIGDKFKRVDDSDLPAEITIVGSRDGNYIAQAVEGFSSPIEITPIQLHESYGADGEQVKQVSEEDAWKGVTPQIIADSANRGSDAAAAAASAESPEDAFRRIDRERGVAERRAVEDGEQAPESGLAAEAVTAARAKQSRA